MEDEAEIGVQTIKVYGDSVGVTSIPEEAAKWLSSEVTFLLKEIVQDASKVFYKLKSLISLYQNDSRNKSF